MSTHRIDLLPLPQRPRQVSKWIELDNAARGFLTEHRKTKKAARATGGYKNVATKQGLPAKEST